MLVSISQTLDYIFFYCCYNNLLLLTLLFKYSPAKQNINASRFVTA